MGDIAKAGRMAKTAKTAKTVQTIKSVSLANLPTNVQDSYRFLSSKKWQTGVGVGEGAPAGKTFVNNKSILPQSNYREFAVNPKKQ